MQVRQSFIIAAATATFFGCLTFLGCSTGVATSPDPGIVRVTLQSDPADTTITITGRSVTVAPTDSFGVTISQGQVYSDTLFANLLRSLDSYRLEDGIYNVLRRENGTYKEYVIFESFVPPGEYDQIQFGATASLLRLGTFNIPVALPDSAGPLISLDIDFQVEAEVTTEIQLRIKPLGSVERFRDTYLFDRQFEVVAVNYL
jgi:hypothetical protein